MFMVSNKPGFNRMISLPFEGAVRQPKDMHG